MHDTVSYPTDDMSSTSRTLTSFLDDQWKQHTALFMTNGDSYTALLQSVAKVIPNAGGQVQELASRLQNYHQQYFNCYQALRTLAQQIDEAAQQMKGADAQAATGFGPTPQ